MDPFKSEDSIFLVALQCPAATVAGAVDSGLKLGLGFSQRRPEGKEMKHWGRDA